MLASAKWRRNRRVSAGITLFNVVARSPSSTVTAPASTASVNPATGKCALAVPGVAFGSIRSPGRDPGLTADG
jgi:hypothetical protein